MLTHSCWFSPVLLVTLDLALTEGLPLLSLDGFFGHPVAKPNDPPTALVPHTARTVASTQSLTRGQAPGISVNVTLTQV